MAEQFYVQDQFMRIMVFGNPSAASLSFNFGAIPDRVSMLSHILDATNTDLSQFRKAGGKLLISQGWSDAAASALGMIDYYERAEQLDNGLPNYARLFMEPGAFHCGGGQGPYLFDALSTMRDWVENRKAPDSIVAAHLDVNGNVDRTRPLCPYPQVAKYSGHGSIDDAANFRCAFPDD